MHSMYGESNEKLEEAVNPKVLATQPFIIRLDGVSFSTFTEGLTKPFDWRLKEALVKTTEDLMKKFVPVTGYHHSDEISLVFPAADDPQRKLQVEPSHMYNGRVQKMVSVTASYAGARFNHHMRAFDWTDLKPRVRERVLGSEAYFDGRVVPLNDMKEAAECLFWRSNMDGFRNSLSAIGQSHFKPKEMHKKSLRDLLGMLEAKGIEVDVEDMYLFGTFVKKEEYVMSGFLDPRTGGWTEGEIKRKRLRRGAFNFAGINEERRTEFVGLKLWEDKEGFPPKDPLVVNEDAMITTS
ncbi:tRNAHis guanylyltransferase-domain-containing protein, partial [Chytridium lagenaria]